MKLNHVISARQFDKKTIEALFALCDRVKSGRFKSHGLKEKIMATLFYEPSTRTRLSFESAMIRLGGRVIATENAGEFSSAFKGETLEDTIRVVASYSDVIVLRHPSRGASEIAAKFSKVPIINAGDGEGEHPTQALLDLYTIFSKLDKSKLTITMVGDLKYGRTIHSLSYFLGLYNDLQIIFVSPKALSIPDSLKKYLKEKNVRFHQTEDFRLGLSSADVVYMTRIQKERFKNIREYKRYFGRYILNKSTLPSLKNKALIMHPLPRVNEIAPQVDGDPRAIFFEQAQNGVYMRMALLIAIFDKM